MPRTSPANARLAAAHRPEVRLPQGRLRGLALPGGVQAYLGIPYAAPPLGPLRWRAPQPPRPWRGVRDADRFGCDPAQTPFPSDAAPSSVAHGEDCLTLNVWTPATPGLHPVLVWIYGGGFANGGTSPAVYDGRALAARGVVLVSLNYRVGWLGFYGHPALRAADTDGGWHGNFGLMDQLAALHWIGNQIGHFGGDAGRITLFGESAGAASIAHLMGSDAARDRFHAALLQSGSLGGTPPSPDAAAEAALRHAHKLGVRGESTAALQALRGLPTDAVVAGLHLGCMAEAGFPGPLADGRLVQRPILDTWRQRLQPMLPLVVGSNSDELGWLAATQGRAQADALAEQRFVGPGRTLLALAQQAGQPAWGYCFRQVALSQRGQGLGATHASEIPFVFGTLAARHGPEGTDAADRAVSRRLQASWVRFARTGRPGWLPG